MRKVPYVKTILGDTETPITVFQKYVGEEVGFLLESKSKDNNRFSFIGAEPKKIIRGDNKNHTEEILRNAIQSYEIDNTTHLPFVGGLVGIMGYEQSSDFFFVTEFIAYDHDYGKILFVALDTDDLEGEKRAKLKLNEMYKRLQNPLSIEKQTEIVIGDYTPNMSKANFMDKVNMAKEYINKGEISQIVLSQRWSCNSNIKPFQLYRNLRSLNPSPYLFYFNFGDCHAIGSSPEMLVKLQDGKISTCPIAGTRKRGSTNEEDRALEKELLEDPKEIEEHKMLVELAKEDMSLVSKADKIIVKDYMKVEKFSHVMHITSIVEGEKTKDKNSIEVLNEFFPAGTLSGAPRQRAMEIIEKLEDDKRGFYGGAAGYIGFDGEMDMCIAIRMMVVKDGLIHMQAGAGIVADSSPEKEYEESENKVKALINAVSMGVGKNERDYGEGY